MASQYIENAPLQDPSGPPKPPKTRFRDKVFRKRNIPLLILALLPLLGLLALRRSHGTIHANDQDNGKVITDDVYFYGQSEPIYPSRK
jgi:hypothetical protein